MQKKMNRIEQAKVSFNKAVELDPLNWTSFKELCDLGVEVSSEKAFNIVKLNLKIKDEVYL